MVEKWDSASPGTWGTSGPKMFKNCLKTFLRRPFFLVLGQFVPICLVRPTPIFGHFPSLKILSPRHTNSLSACAISLSLNLSPPRVLLAHLSCTEGF